MRFLKFALVAGSMLVAASASAQTPPPAQPGPPAAGGTPDKLPFDIPYGQAIGAEKAKQVLAMAEAEGKKRG